MRKYYLFIIKSDYYKNYKNNSYVLYNTLRNLYMLNQKNFSYGVSLYHSVCQLISKDLLIRYIQRKYHHQTICPNRMKIFSSHETSIVEINHSCIVVLTNVNFPDILKTFYIYHKKIFICDFYNEDYFWLSDQMKKVK